MVVLASACYCHQVVLRLVGVAGGSVRVSPELVANFYTCGQLVVTACGQRCPLVVVVVVADRVRQTNDRFVLPPQDHSHASHHLGAWYWLLVAVCFAVELSFGDGTRPRTLVAPLNMDREQGK